MNNCCKFRVLNSLLFFCLLSSSLFADTPRAPTNTKIIDNFSCLGIDNPNPRFAWVVNDSNRGEYQTAYQLMVIADEEDNSGKELILWDSGKISSSQQYGIVYNGKPLNSTKKYVWKVRTWNKEGIVSPWSEPSSFVTGFFNRNDWDHRAEWIRYPEASSQSINPLPIFRKQFRINKKIKHAWFFICGLGQFNSYLNGAKIGDHIIDPAWTDYDKSVDYVTFDVSANLHTGDNAIGVMLGNGVFANKGMRDFGPLRLKAQLHVDFIDGTSTDIVTDTTWKVKQSPFIDAAFDGSENYDARLELPGWDMPKFADTNWEYAAVASAPKGKLVSQSSPPVVIVKSFKPIRITSPAPGVLVYDFGQNMNGIFKFNINGLAGSVVKIMPGEDTTANGRAQQGRTKGVTYTLNGKENESWQMSFSTIGFRYLEFQNVSQKRDPKNNAFFERRYCTVCKFGI